MVVCVQDSLSDPSILRLLDRAFGWKPLVLVDDIVGFTNIGISGSLSKVNMEHHQLDKQQIPATATQSTCAVDSKAVNVTAVPTEADIEGEITSIDVGGEVDVEDEEEGAVACEAPGSDETGLGQTPTAAPNVHTSTEDDADVVAAVRAKVNHIEEVAEQAEVLGFVKKLQRECRPFPFISTSILP